MKEEDKKEIKNIALKISGMIVFILIGVFTIDRVGDDIKFNDDSHVDIAKPNKTIEKKELKQKVTKTKKKIEKTMMENYKELPKATIFKGKKIFLSIDNNGRPCYLMDSRFLNAKGEFIPFNFVPSNMKCENTELIEILGEKMVKIKSLDSMKDSKHTPEGYRYYIEGEGLNSVLQNCGNFWSDKCDGTTQSKILISLAGPEGLPRVTSFKTIILTKKGLLDGISEPTVRYEKNENFFVWTKLPFESPYAYNGLIDGKIVKSAREAYELKPKIAIDITNSKVYIQSINDEGICYFNKNNFPINIEGKEIPIKEIPPKIQCQDLKEKDGFLLLENLDSVVGYDSAKKGMKIKVKIGSGFETVEKCGKYWADSCEEAKTRRIVITKGDRSSLPYPKSAKRLSLTKHLGKQKVNLPGGKIHSSGYYIWDKAVIPTSVYEMAVLPVCKTNCYNEADLDGVKFLLTSHKNIVHRKTNQNGVKLLLSMDNRKVLSPKTARWSYIKNYDQISGVSKDGLFYKKLKGKHTIFEAKKKCAKIGMRLPVFEEASVENNDGIYTSDWTWMNQMIDNKYFTAWDDKSVLKAGNEEEFDTICVERY